MYPLHEQVAATLKVLGLRPVDPDEGAAHLNRHGLADADGHAWTAASLAAYLDAHNIRPEILPDMRNFKPAVADREWNARSILRAIERGPDDVWDRLRQSTVDDAVVRREVIALCLSVNDCPYRPGLYREWLDFARQYDG